MEWGEVSIVSRIKKEKYSEKWSFVQKVDVKTETEPFVVESVSANRYPMDKTTSVQYNKNCLQITKCCYIVLHFIFYHTRENCIIWLAVICHMAFNIKAFRIGFLQ